MVEHGSAVGRWGVLMKDRRWIELVFARLDDDGKMGEI